MYDRDDINGAGAFLTLLPLIVFTVGRDLSSLSDALTPIISIPLPLQPFSLVCCIVLYCIVIFFKLCHAIHEMGRQFWTLHHQFHYIIHKRSTKSIMIIQGINPV